MVRGGSTSSEKKKEEPTFFKIIKTGFSTDDLRIPPKFCKHILNELSGTAILKLKGSKEHSWTVVVCRIGLEIYFTNGWQEFVRDNSLGNFEFLVFRYERDMRFSIEIYDRNACIRTREQSTVAYNSSRPTHQGKPKRCKKSAASHGAPRYQSCEIKEEEDVYQDEDATTVLDSDLPKFISTIRLAYSLGVPTDFSREHLPQGYYHILLENSKGRKWRVKVVPSNYTVKLSQGWTKFKRDNGIQCGDICTFKLVQRNRMVVHIIRK